MLAPHPRSIGIAAAAFALSLASAASFAADANASATAPAAPPAAMPAPAAAPGSYSDRNPVINHLPARAIAALARGSLAAAILDRARATVAERRPPLARIADCLSAMQCRERRHRGRARSAARTLRCRGLRA